MVAVPDVAMYGTLSVVPTNNPKIGFVVFWILVALTHPLTHHRNLGLDLESSQEWGNALALVD